MVVFERLGYFGMNDGNDENDVSNWIRMSNVEVEVVAISPSCVVVVVVAIAVVTVGIVVMAVVGCRG